MAKNKIQILFIHQNFPGQFKMLAPELALNSKYEIHAMFAEDINTNIPGIKYHRYNINKLNKAIHPLALEFESKMIRAESAFEEAEKLKEDGLNPRVIITHPGWGESFLLRVLWPDAKFLSYHEFYYSIADSDIDFDDTDPYRAKDQTHTKKKLIARNSPLLTPLVESDVVITPTEFQKSTAPELFHDKISVIHDGVDTEAIKFYTDSFITVKGGESDIKLTKDSKVVSFVNRTLEPYRGYHKFIKSIPAIQKEHPDAYFILVGDKNPDNVSYGGGPPKGQSYKDLFLKDVIEDLDMSKIIFPGKIAYEHLLSLFCITSAHVYLTYPFVLSWSMLEAMACEALVIGSSTKPVKEVIEDKKNGLLVDFFDIDGISAKVIDVLSNPQKYEKLRKNARKTIVEKYDLKKVSLPKQIKLIESLLK